jgi:hypothetical protein
LWSDLHSARHPSHLTSTSHPHHHHHGTRLDSTAFLLANATSNSTWSLLCIPYQLRHRTTIGRRVARSLYHHTSTALPSHQTARLPANMSCIPAVRQCPITPYAARKLPLAVPLLRIHRIDLSACSRTASQYDSISSYPSC